MRLTPRAASALLVGVGGLLFAATSSAFDDKQPPAKGDKSPDGPLVGVYTIVSGEKDGKPIPEDRIKGSLVRFTADGIVGTDREKKEFFAATYTLDTSKKPWVIKMKSKLPKEVDAVGLVKKEGDTVTLVYALPDADAPIEFRTQARQHLFVLKEMKTAKPKPDTKLTKNP